MQLAIRADVFSALKKSGSIEANAIYRRAFQCASEFSALKKSGSIEAAKSVKRIARHGVFSALKKSGSIEASSLSVIAAGLLQIFRFEKKRLH